MTAAFPDLILVLPELILAVGAMALLMIGVFAGDGSARLVNALAVGVLLAAAVAVFGVSDGTTMAGAFVVDGFARFLKVATLIGSAVAIVLALRFAQTENFERF